MCCQREIRGKIQAATGRDLWESYWTYNVSWENMTRESGAMWSDKETLGLIVQRIKLHVEAKRQQKEG